MHVYLYVPIINYTSSVVSSLPLTLEHTLLRLPHTWYSRWFGYVSWSGLSAIADIPVLITVPPSLQSADCAYLGASSGTRPRKVIFDRIGKCKGVRLQWGIPFDRPQRMSRDANPRILLASA